VGTGREPGYCRNKELYICTMMKEVCHTSLPLLSCNYFVHIDFFALYVRIIPIRWRGRYSAAGSRSAKESPVLPK